MIKLRLNIKNIGQQCLKRDSANLMQYIDLLQASAVGSIFKRNGVDYCITEVNKMNVHEIKIEIGQKVQFAMYPFCSGEIVEIRSGLKVGDIHLSDDYRAKWDNPEYGESGWLSDYDFLLLETEEI